MSIIQNVAINIVVVNVLGCKRPKITLKVNQKDNTITIKPVKDSWNREEVRELIYEHTNFLLSGKKQELEEY